MKSSSANQKEKPQHILGIIDTSSRHFIRIKILFQESSAKHQVFYELFTLDSIFEIRKLCGLSTIGREFVGLDNIRKFVLKKCLLNPKEFYNSQKVKKNKYLTISKKVLELIKKNFNENQVKAIKNSLKLEGITLIQGPPGTGKTKLIMGVLAVLFSSEPKQDKVNKLSEKEREKILKLNQLTVNPNLHFLKKSLKIKKTISIFFDIVTKI
jgi:senataxin